MTRTKPIWIPARLSAALGALLLAGACGATSDGAGDGGANAACTPGATMPCYNGPVGTQEVGSCVGGLQTCSEDGRAWSPCRGEVTPLPEVCANGLDEDCNGTPDDVADVDLDGYTRCDGDCCETLTQCEAPEKVNPGAVEVISEDGSASADENCNGMIDEGVMLCDDGLALDDADPINAARAIDLCQDGSAGSYGLVSAAYQRADGSSFAANAQHGIQASFGPNVPPQFGNSMLALSTGAARSSSQADACGTESCTFNSAGTPPAGFPQDVPGCDGASDINDDIALSLSLRAPINATGYSFDFMFYSFEYPEWVCTDFNDQFVALVDPPPTGSINGNIAFDSLTNPVSVNIAFFDVCEGCPAGTTALAGTGFDAWNDAGATTWLRTQAPVEGGSEFTIRFTIWDTGDSAFDSTVLIDNFQWLADPVGVDTTPID